jgi:ribonuclease HI
MNQIVIHTDGASRGNPGPASIAYVIEGLEDKPVEFKQAIGTYSNNQAEYRAMVAALEYLTAQNLENNTVDIMADSELMIKQINGEYRVKDVNLQPLYRQVIDFCQLLKNGNNALSFTAIRREQNQEADRLANVALDEL